MSRDWTQEELQAASMAMQEMGELGYEEFRKEIEEAERTEVRFDLTGTTRKVLVKAAEQIVGAKATYKELPTLAYELKGFTFTKEGTLVRDERTAPEAVERLVTALTEQGYKYWQRPQNRPQRARQPLTHWLLAYRRMASQTRHWRIWTGLSRRRAPSSRKHWVQTALPTRLRMKPVI